MANDQEHGWLVEAQFTIQEIVVARTAADAMMTMGDRVRALEDTPRVNITDMRVSIPKEEE